MATRGCHYIFFIGGSGARAYKAFLHACASGAVPVDEIRVMLLDADSHNAACTECVELYRLYRWHHNMVQGKLTALKSGERRKVGAFHAFHCDVRMYHEQAISPVESSDRNLSMVVRGTPGGDRALRWFYNEEERQQDLLNGFYAHPNIGCIFFRNFNSSNPAQKAKFEQCLEDIAADLRSGQDVRVVICGSLFGGTGAAGIPTVLNMVSNHCRTQKISEDLMRLLHFGGVLLTPYFKVSEKPEKDGNITIDSDAFLSNTKAALQYYQFTDEFERIYLVGQEDPELVNPEYKDGGAAQKNKPHIVELFAAMGIKDFLCGCPGSDKILGKVQVQILPKTPKDPLSWYSDSFDPDFQVFADMLRAQTLLEAGIYPYIEQRDAESGVFSGMSQWFKVFNMRRFSMEDESSDTVSMREYSERFLDWMYQIQHQYSGKDMIRNGDVALCGDAIEAVEDCVQKRKNKGRNPTNGDKERPNYFEIVTRFNDTVEMFKNMGFLVETALDLISALGVVPKAISRMGAGGLFIWLLKWASYKKAP